MIALYLQEKENYLLMVLLQIYLHHLQKRAKFYDCHCSLKNRMYKSATQRKLNASTEVGLKNYLCCEKILRRKFTNPTPTRSARANEPYIAIEIGIYKITKLIKLLHPNT